MKKFKLIFLTAGACFLLQENTSLAEITFKTPAEPTTISAPDLKTAVEKIIPAEFKIFHNYENLPGQEITWVKNDNWISALKEITSANQLTFSIVENEININDPNFILKTKEKTPLAVSSFLPDGNPALDPPKEIWNVQSGSTLKSTLEEWGSKAGWGIAWHTSYNFPIEASAAFKGDFEEAAKNLLESFAFVKPNIKARFYRGNKTIVIKTLTRE